jgi:hypothetical protein
VFLHIVFFFVMVFFKIVCRFYFLILSWLIITIVVFLTKYYGLIKCFLTCLLFLFFYEFFQNFIYRFYFFNIELGKNLALLFFSLKHCGLLQCFLTLFFLFLCFLFCMIFFQNCLCRFYFLNIELIKNLVL